MGRKGRETTVQERRIIIKLHNETKSLSEISRTLGRPRSTIQSIIDRFGVEKTLRNQPRSGRPQALSARDKAFIVRTVKKDPKTSAPRIASELEERGVKVHPDTVRNALKKEGYHGRVARKKLFVNAQNRKKRLAFALKHVNKSNEFWKRVIFTDESKYQIFGSDGRKFVWRKANTEVDPKNLTPTVKHGGGSVLVWGAMSAAGVSNLCFIEGIMDHKMYINILKTNLAPSATKMGLDNNFIFMQDNDPKHTAHNTKLWILHRVPQHLQTPPQSPDINPIEHLWEVGPT